MAPPPPFRATIFDSQHGTLLCGLGLALGIASAVRLLVLGHL